MQARLFDRPTADQFFTGGDRSFAGDAEGYPVGEPWHGRATAGGRVARESGCLARYTDTEKEC